VQATGRDSDFYMAIVALVAGHTRHTMQASDRKRLDPDVYLMEAQATFVKALRRIVSLAPSHRVFYLVAPIFVAKILVPFDMKDASEARTVAVRPAVAWL